ncbi:pentapeptide repeat-containing protein [Actinocrispum wychmicini]|nr:pentapeptide repeat-containing protein [Actinocrispum wychmicini]
MRTSQALSWWIVALGGAVVAGVTWGATAWLLEEANQAKDPAAARVEAVKTGLGIGAGTGGVFALLLAVRRQWHQEVSAAATELDAAEKRVTELYTKAVEQLGSDKAPVRLGGLYALERVGQNNPGQRQTIVNVLCAYLRMPYERPGEPPDRSTAHDAVVKDYRMGVQEREVRLTVQKLLAAHLTPGDERDIFGTFWKDIDLDLNGTLLIDFDLHLCRVNRVIFKEAVFAGDASFRGTTFTGDANFAAAKFKRSADFTEANFTKHAGFRRATFTGHALFNRARFTGFAGFVDATFSGYASFRQATFTGGIHALKHSTFAEEPQFAGARFPHED